MKEEHKAVVAKLSAEEKKNKSLKEEVEESKKAIEAAQKL